VRPHWIKALSERTHEIGLAASLIRFDGDASRQSHLWRRANVHPPRTAIDERNNYQTHRKRESAGSYWY
jgi:hypothetical protein